MNIFQGEALLSSTQTLVLDTPNLNRLTQAIRSRCGKVCPLEVKLDSEDQKVISSCADCVNPDNIGISVKLVSKLANSLILDSSLVSSEIAERLNTKDNEQIQLVQASMPTEYDGNGTILIGTAATVIRKSGYVRIEQGNVLFYAKSFDEQGLINPGALVLIERSAPVQT